MSDPNIMPKYKVTYEFRARITIDVEAEDEKAAEREGSDEAWESIGAQASLYDVIVREVA